LSACSVGLKIHLLKGADYQQQAADEIAALSCKSAPAWDLHQHGAKFKICTSGELKLLIIGTHQANLQG